MVVKAAGTSTQNISWYTAPTFQTRATGVVEFKELAQFIKNPSNLSFTAQLVPTTGPTGIPGNTYPSGWSQENNSGRIRATNAGVVARKTLRWVATAQGKASVRSPPGGWVETLAAIVETPARPEGVTATAMSVSEIEIAWTAGVGGSNPVKYRIYEALAAGGPWSDSYIAEDTASPYTRSGLPTSAQRWYYVTAVDANDAESQPSLADDAMTFDDPIPHIVQNFVVALHDATTIRVSWQPPLDGPTPTGYKIYRASSGGGVFAVIAPNHPASPYDDEDVPPGDSRYYKVAAMNGANEGPPSAVLFATTPPLIVPATPTNLALEVLSSQAIRLTWQAGEGGSTVTAYRVYRATTSGGYSGTPLATVTSAEQQAADTFNRADSAELGTSWDAASGAGFNVVSNTAKKTAFNTSDGWEANNTASWPADQYSEITIAAAGGAAALGRGVGPAVRMSSAVPPARTMYRLVGSAGGYELAKLVAGVSGVTLTSAATPTFTVGDVVRLSVRGTATAVLRCYKNGVEFVTHSDATNPLTTGKPGIVYKATDTTAAIQSWGGGGNFQYDSIGLQESTTYYYVVKAFDGTNESGASVEKSALTHTVSPTVPTITAVVPLASSPQDTLRVSWVAGSGGSVPTYYNLYRSPTQGGTYTQVAGSGNIAATSYNNPGLAADTPYWYKVRAFDEQDDQSDQSTAVSGATAPALTPTMPTITSVTAQSVSVLRVAWQPGTGGSTLSGYRVWRSSGSSGTFTDQVGGDRPITLPLQYDNTGLAPGAIWWYRVSAFDATSESAQSPPVQGQTLLPLEPAVPVSVTAQAMSTTSIKVAWLPGQSGSVLSGYRVYRSQTSGGTYTPIGGDRPTSPTSYTNTGLDVGATWFYKVSAFDANNESAQSTPPASATTDTSTTWPEQTTTYLPCVPNAAGWGTNTVAGSGRQGSVRGGNNGPANTQVVHVTNTAASGAGSFPAVLDSISGPRTIVFDCEGVCTLGGLLSLDQPFCTIAGQTAPGKGFMVTRATFAVFASDVLIQHFHSRPGDASGGTEPVAGGARDAFRISSLSGSPIQRVVLDHCSGSWAIDDNMGTGSSAGASNCTFIDCLFAEGLDTIYEDAHGVVFGNTTAFQSIIRSVMLNALQRTPLTRSPDAVVCNCVIFNVVSLCTDLQSKDNLHATSRNSVIANVYARCPVSNSQCVRMRGTEDPTYGVSTSSKLYMCDNRAGTTLAGATLPSSQWNITRFGTGLSSGANGITTSLFVLANAPTWPQGLVPENSANVLDLILAGVGAFPLNRDSADTRFINDLRNSTVRAHPASVAAAGGMPTYGSATVNHGAGDDPIPPNGSGLGTVNEIMPSGYTRLEEWLQRKARAIEP